MDEEPPSYETLFCVSDPAANHSLLFVKQFITVYSDAQSHQRGSDYI